MPQEIERRQFLALGAAAALTIGVGEPARAEEAENQEPSHTMKKAVKIGMVKVKGSLQEKFQLLRDLGFDGVELDSPSGLDPDEVIAARDATGIEIPGVVDSVHWRHTLSDPQSEIRDQGRKALERAMQDCKLFGGNSVLLVPAVVNQQVSYDQAYERSQAEIRKVLPLAAELEVTIAIENVWNQFLLSPLEAVRYLDELESPWVGWHLDIGNLVNYGWPEQWVRILDQRIKKLDIKEYSRKQRDDEGLWKGFHVKIGDGDCGWPRVMKALDDIGYDGWATAEVAGGGRERLADIAARMDRVLTR